jgi:hypothetical protein
MEAVLRKMKDETGQYLMVQDLATGLAILFWVDPYTWLRDSPEPWKPALMS